jgi:hypothetical protein
VSKDDTFEHKAKPKEIWENLHKKQSWDKPEAAADEEEEEAESESSDKESRQAEECVSPAAKKLDETMKQMSATSNKNKKGSNSSDADSEEERPLETKKGRKGAKRKSKDRREKESHAQKKGKTGRKPTTPKVLAKFNEGGKQTHFMRSMFCHNLFC